MAGLDPAIRVFGKHSKEDVDARVKPGHDERLAVIPGRCKASNPESRDSGSGPSDHPGMTVPVYSPDKLNIIRV
jgi:hypothetical protein